VVKTLSAEILEADGLLLITLLLDATRERVFEAWTDPAQLAQWWGPKGFTNPVCDVDPRPGGGIFIHMRGPDGTVYPMTGRFEEVVRPERLIFTTAPLNEQGRPLFRVLNRVTFAEPDTTLVLQTHAFDLAPEADPYLDGMPQGWSQSLERLELHLERMKQAR